MTNIVNTNKILEIVYSLRRIDNNKNPNIIIDTPITRLFSKVNLFQIIFIKSSCVSKPVCVAYILEYNPKFNT